MFNDRNQRPPQLPNLESIPGFESLAGLRASQAQHTAPWVITKEEHLSCGTILRWTISLKSVVEYRIPMAQA